MRLFIAIISLLLVACHFGEKQADGNAIDGDEKKMEPRQAIRLPQYSEMYTAVANLRIREEPGTKGKEIARLPETSVVIPTGKKSDFTTDLTLRGMRFSEPWLEVEAGDISGWIFAGALDFIPNSKFNLELLNNRINSLTSGKVNGDQLKTFNDQVYQLNDASQVPKLLDIQKELQRKINSALEKKVEIGDEVPGRRWLDGAVSGLLSSRVAEGTKLQLFMDYKAWKTIASQTEGEADDLYFDFLDHLNGVEGKENQWGHYFQQMWDYGGSSLLGAGVHLQLFQEAEAIFTKHPEFSILVQKNTLDILHDILHQENTYWNNLAAIKSEMNEIISSDFTVISQENKAFLRKRLDAFKDYEKNGIKINQKNG